MDISKVASCKIYPGIGIGRLGNSPDDYFVGPEAPGIVPSPAGGFKDARGRVKRQAARFRIYAYDKDGRLLDELTAV
ncbi:MAG TPA: LodA/GoxA family CTQ-dependent oxidase, partial [Kofleriaceae bacterium]|nr:LodA/GoxA family CTQ-dependent oxidase [Kofleriaceae bacterium]